MVTAYSYFFGAIFVGLASVCVLSSGESHKDYKIPTEVSNCARTLLIFMYTAFTYCYHKHPVSLQAMYGLFFAIAISVLCSVLVTWTNKYLSAIIVTAFWPLQVSFNCRHPSSFCRLRTEE